MLNEHFYVIFRHLINLFCICYLEGQRVSPPPRWLLIILSSRWNFCSNNADNISKHLQNAFPVQKPGARKLLVNQIISYTKTVYKTTIYSFFRKDRRKLDRCTANGVIIDILKKFGELCSQFNNLCYKVQCNSLTFLPWSWYIEAVHV